MERIKVWSILMLFMIIPLRSSAQVYTELDLIGKWTLTETTGDPNFLTGFDFIIPKPKLYSDNDYDNRSKMYYKSTFSVMELALYDLLVTTGNIMHFKTRIKHYGSGYTDYSYVLKIKTLTSNQMVLMSLDGNETWTFQRTTSSNTNALQMKEETNDDYYNLQGVKIDHPKENELYIQSGKKTRSRGLR